MNPGAKPDENANHSHLVIPPGFYFAQILNANHSHSHLPAPEMRMRLIKVWLGTILANENENHLCSLFLNNREY